MGTFGEFEPIRPIHRSAGSAVYLARKVSDPDLRFALKIYASHSTFVPVTLNSEDGDSSFEAGNYDFSESDETTKLLLAERLELVRLQRDLALALGDGGHWVTIHETGLTADGPFAVMEWYPRSIDTLSRAGGGARMGPTSIYHIVASVVRGLIELRDRASRAHGNLKSSNVFLEGGGRRVTDWRVRLADIGYAAEATEATDVACLGHLLYHCVTRQEFRIADFEVQDSEAWRRLGRKSAKWRELCARMVDPSPARRPSLDEVALALRRLKARRLVPAPYDRYLMVLVLGAVATTVIGYTIWFRQNSRTWTQYSTTYTDWYFAARSVISPEEAGGDSLYKSLDERFRKDKPGPTHCDDAVMMRHWEEWKEIRAPQPTSIPAYNPFRASQLADANRQAEELVQAIQSWPARQDLELAAKALKEIGWTEAAEYLDRIASDPITLLSGKGEPSPEQFAASLAIVADLNRAFGQYKKDSADHLLHHIGILDHLEKMDDEKLRSADPALGGIKQRIGKALASAATFTDGKPDAYPAEAIFDFRVKHAAKKAAVLSMDLKSLNQNLRAVADQLQPINEAIAAGLWVPNPQAPEPGQSIEQLVESLRSRLVYSRQAARNPPWIDAPVVADIASKLSTLKSANDRLTPLFGPDKKWASQFLNASALASTQSKFEADLRQIEEAQKALAEIKKQPFPAKLARIQADLDKLADSVSKIDAESRRKEVDELIRAGKIAEARGNEDFKGWQEKRFKPTQAGVDPLADARAAVWARWLPELAKAAGKLDAPTATKLYDEAAAALEGYAIPVPPSDDALKGLEPGATVFGSVYLDQLKAMWPSFLAEKLLQIADGVMKNGVVGADQLRSAANEQAGVYRADQSILLDAAKSAGELRLRLLQCERFNQRPVSIGQAADSLAERKRQMPGKAGEILRADARISQLLDDASGIRSIERLNSKITEGTFSSADRVELKRIASGTRVSLETRRNAWWVLQRMTEERIGANRKLATDVDPWPFNETELQEELLNRRTLLAELNQRATQQTELGQNPASWRSAVEGELKYAGPKTLRRYIDRIVASARLGEVRSTIQGLTIKELTQGFSCDTDFKSTLPAIVRARELIEETMAQRPAKDDRSNREQMEKLQAALTALVADPDCPVAVKKFNDTLTQKLNTKAAAVRPGFELTGPAKLDWKYEVTGDDRVRYTWAAGGKPVVLEFVRISPTASSFLATTELSLEMANAIMKSAVAKKYATPDWKDFWTLVVDKEAGKAIDSGDLSRRGPRDWTWAQTELIPSPFWMTRSDDPHYPTAPGQTSANKKALPTGFLGGEPQLSHPLHRISPAEAVYLATLSGARLPTKAEWLMAYAAETAAGKPVWNRRDEVFASQVRHAVAHQLGVNKLDFPDTMIFVPKGFLPLSPAGPNAVKDNVQADSVLWFCPVDSNGATDPKTGKPMADNAPGAIFKHLVGNVAEFITEAAVLPVSMRQGNGVGTDELARSVERWVRDEKQRIEVIGGSALSPPEFIDASGARLAVRPDLALPVDVATTPISWKLAFSDVGVRLAIDVPNAGESLTKWFDDQLAPLPESLGSAHRDMVQATWGQ